ncbi:MAG: Ig-like domain-containing protein [Gemmatimonadetes bacterium]|nr:Ig-like domain-containing protein [Gemmatimonadota bacterium]
MTAARRSRPFAFGVLSLTLLVGSCETGPSGPPPVALLQVLSSGLTGEVATSVTVAVRAVDAGGSPIAGIPVAFTATSESGNANPAVVTTLADGSAVSAWTLGTRAGTQVLRAVAGAVSAEITAQATPAVPARLLPASGDGQQGAVGAPLSAPVVVEVQDRFGNAVPGVTVTFAVTAGDGSVTPASGQTDASGRVAATWTLGTKAGGNGLEARAGSLVPVTFVAAGLPGPAASMEKVAGDVQEGTVARALASPVVVEVRDRFGNAVPGAAVSFAVTGGGGSVVPPSAETDASGRTSTTWTLGTRAGTQTLEARVANVGPATFTARARPGPPAALAKVSGDGQEATVATVLSGPVSVEVRDSFANGVPGQPVTFVVTVGGGSLTPGTMLTDSVGRARATWTLGTVAGTNALEARSASLAPATFTATARPGPPASIAKLSGDVQEGTVGTALAAAPVVEVRDEFRNLVPGATVTFAVTVGGGSASPASPQTDSAGRASTAWALGTAAGSQTLEARVGNLTPARFTATAKPGPAAALVKVSGDGQEGRAGAALQSALVAAVQDRYGNGVAGETVTFTVTGGGGSVTPSSRQTDASGRASATWTLGPSLGAHTLEARAGSLAPVTFSATARSGAPASVVKVSGDGQQATVGTALPAPLVVEVRDQFGNRVRGEAVSFVVTVGAGTASPATTQTDTSGRASTTWTLGTAAGTQRLEARVGSLSPAVFTAVGLPGAAAEIVKAAGDGQSARVGTPVAIPPSVRARDRFGNAVPGVTVTFAVTAGGGSVTGATQITDGGGTAAVGSWTLGPTAGTNTLTAAVAGLSPVTFTATATVPPAVYDIEVRYVGSVGASVQAVVNSGVSRWTRAVTGELPDIPVSLTAGTCAGVAYPALNETVDDLLVFVQVVSIDGPGSTLATGGPCLIRTVERLSVIGGIRVDTGDLSRMESEGTLNDVVLHELGHVIGIGSLWGQFGLLVGAGTEDPYFSGANAIASFRAAGGSHASGVPVENTGGSGTRDAHWREAVLRNELMTGVIDIGGNPLSAISIASLRDIGYTVNLAAADPYAVPSPALAAAPGVIIELRDDVIWGPLFEVDEEGRVRPVGRVR